jgi:ATP-dependent Clp protease protease subunit
LREINLNGYIDDEDWFGDEITPELLHEAVYGSDGQATDDIHIRLNSYGGSCNAATRMFDDLRAYPGNVHLTVSGTAASAATVLAMAANHLEMTPGSLWMVHDPSVLAWGNERDLADAINLLKACKESILNIYQTRCTLPRTAVSEMMTATTWMDANGALAMGFIDKITEATGGASPSNAYGNRAIDRDDAAAKVQAWLERRKSPLPRQSIEVEQPAAPPEAAEPPGANAPLEVAAPPEPPDPPDPDTPTQNLGTPIAQLRKRLGLLMPAKRSHPNQ